MYARAHTYIRMQVCECNCLRVHACMYTHTCIHTRAHSARRSHQVRANMTCCCITSAHTRASSTVAALNTTEEEGDFSANFSPSIVTAVTLRNLTSSTDIRSPGLRADSRQPCLINTHRRRKAKAMSSFFCSHPLRRWRTSPPCSPSRAEAVWEGLGRDSRLARLSLPFPLCIAPAPTRTPPLLRFTPSTPHLTPHTSPHTSPHLTPHLTPHTFTLTYLSLHSALPTPFPLPQSKVRGERGEGG